MSCKACTCERGCIQLLLQTKPRQHACVWICGVVCSWHDGLLEACEREVLMPPCYDWSTLTCCCCAEELNHSAPCCSLRLLVWFNIILSPVVARRLNLDYMHSALQVILCIVIGEKQERHGLATTLLGHEGVPLQGLFPSRGCALISQKLIGIRFSPSKLCFVLTQKNLLIFSAIALAKLCSNTLITIWSWLAYMHTVSLQHMGTFQRLC